jgi:hypothetical protein
VLFLQTTGVDSSSGIFISICCRYYVQPQWILDSVNARELMPVEKYFLGAVLPPHLSPFIDKTREQYIPPEERALEDPSSAEVNQGWCLLSSTSVRPFESKVYIESIVLVSCHVS